MTGRIGTRCSVATSTLRGVEAIPVQVEVDVSSGLPSFALVGLPDAAVQEARERVRSAVRASGFTFPNARVVVNLAPGPLRKHGTGFDLPIAAALLAATGQLSADGLDDCVLVGELSLDGTVRAVPGMIAHALAARRRATLIGSTHARTICQLEDLDYWGISRLADLKGPRRRTPPGGQSLGRTPECDSGDMGEVHGQEYAKRALQIAAAGGHNVLMVGPPGSGKTMLARRLSGILPPLTPEECIETALVHSVAGIDESRALGGARPFRAPHHSCSIAGLVGGGPAPRPGEVSLAHNGVLFLDEMPEFGPAALQALRQPLEDGEIVLVRADGRVRFPARIALVGAANPCPCGYLGDPVRHCTCPPAVVSGYAARVGGPLMDRIDLYVRVGRVDARRVLEPTIEQSSATMRERVVAARERALRSDRPSTSRLTGAGLLSACRMTPQSCRDVERAATAYQLSGRGITRLLRVARSIADLDDIDAVGRDQIDEAVAYRFETGGDRVAAVH